MTETSERHFAASDPPRPLPHIKEIHIMVSGDPSVGIPNTSYKMEVNLDLDIFNSHQEMMDYLRSLKKTVHNIYHMIEYDWPINVMYDYELELERKAEDETYRHKNRDHQKRV